MHVSSRIHSRFLRYSRAAALALLIAAGVAFSLPPTSVVRAQAPGSGVLLHAGHLGYLGAFRLPGPTGNGEENTFGYGGEAMAFDPYRDSLWITGHDWYDRLAEVTIPTPSRTDPPVASFKTSWIDMSWRQQVGGDAVNMGGIFPLPNGDLILSAYTYYDASVSQRVSHVRRRADGSMTRPVQVGSFGTGYVSGYMIPIPTEWQGVLGGPALTGNSSLSIISRTSLGPAAAVFNPDDVGRVSPVPASQVLAYPLDHPTLGTMETGRTFNGGASNDRAGIVWPNGTRSILYFHRVCAAGVVTYNGGYDCPRGRQTQVLAIDANDLVDVKQGRKQPWDVEPYAIWNIGSPLSTARLTAATYDPVRKWIFVAEDHGDGSQPLIHVYEIGAASSVAPAPPVSFDPSARAGRSSTRTGLTTRHAVARSRETSGDEGEDGERHEDSVRGVDATAGPARSAEPAALVDLPANKRRPLTSVREKAAAVRDRSRPLGPSRTVGPKTTPRAPSDVCEDSNPFPNGHGWIGVCVNGEWRLAPGVRAWGTVRPGPGPGGEPVWFLETDDAVYQVIGLAPEFQQDGLTVFFEGQVASPVPSADNTAAIIEIRHVVSLPVP